MIFRLQFDKLQPEEEKCVNRWMSVFTELCFWNQKNHFSVCYLVSHADEVVCIFLLLRCEMVEICRILVLRRWKQRPGVTQQPDSVNQ